MFQTEVTEKIKAHILGSVIFYKKNRAVYEITWKNIVERGRPQIIIWRMRIACCVPKAANTQSEYVILISVPLQQRLPERASVLRYTYVACFLSCKKAFVCISAKFVV